jgi:hypothetical protein
MVFIYNNGPNESIYKFPQQSLVQYGINKIESNDKYYKIDWHLKHKVK